MARFIPIDKMKSLREAARNGDERARLILSMQLGGKDDFSSLLEEFFAPKPEPTPDFEVVGEEDNLPPNLAKFLQENGVVKGDENYDSFIEEYYSENPDEPRILNHEEEQTRDGLEGIDLLIADELEAIRGYDEQIIAVASSNLPDSMKKGIIASYNEIKSDELEHIEELKRIKCSLEKKQEDKGL